jgi:hypothetical protein
LLFHKTSRKGCEGEDLIRALSYDKQEVLAIVITDPQIWWLFAVLMAGRPPLAETRYPSTLLKSAAGNAVNQTVQTGVMAICTSGAADLSLVETSAMACDEHRSRQGPQHSPGIDCAPA